MPMSDVAAHDQVHQALDTVAQRGSNTVLSQMQGSNDSRPTQTQVAPIRISHGRSRRTS